MQLLRTAWLPEPATLLYLTATLYLLHKTIQFFTGDCDIRTLNARIRASKFRARVVWITGASSTIGSSLAHALAQQGSLLILSGRNAAALNRLAADLPCPPQHVHVLAFDLRADATALHAVASQVPPIFGRLDFIFNNAAVTTSASALDFPMPQFAAVMSVNCHAPIALARAVAPALARNPGGAGTVVNTLSISALQPCRQRASYAASKAAMHAYFNCFRLEHAGRKLQVLNIFPGSVLTPISHQAFTKLEGKLYGNMHDNIAQGLCPHRVADRMLAAVSNGIDGAIIATPRELLATRLYLWTWCRLEDLQAIFFKKTIPA